MNDWVATAPTPGSAQMTLDPTANQCDCTAAPISPVAGSRATIENVCTGRRCGSSCATAEPTTNADTHSTLKMRFMGFPFERRIVAEGEDRRCEARAEIACYLACAKRSACKCCSARTRT